jgi:hypothetical protein
VGSTFEKCFLWDPLKIYFLVNLLKSALCFQRNEYKQVWSLFLIYKKLERDCVASLSKGDVWRRNHSYLVEGAMWVTSDKDKGGSAEWCLSLSLKKNLSRNNKLAPTPEKLSTCFLIFFL